MKESTLSSRGDRVASHSARIDFELYYEAVHNLYHPEKNPNGHFPLNVAENKLNWPNLQAKLAAIMRSKEVPGWASRYGDPSGVSHFKKAVASFLEKFLFHCPVEPNTLAFSSGLTSVIEQTAFVLCDKGDTAVIPAPGYPVYTSDLGVKSVVKRFDLQTHTEVSELHNGLRLTVDHLENALETLHSQGETFKMLILTAPDNPTGGIYDKDQLKKIAAWCIDHHIHLIVNEIYGLSIIDTSHPDISTDYSTPAPFESFGKHIAEQKSPYLHYWYSFSKDFGVSGFRIGMVHSYNQEFIQAYGNINLTHSVSNLTQWVMQQVLEDYEFVKNYLEENQRRLTESYAVVARHLKNLNIPYAPSRGSLFIWMDFSELLQNHTDEEAENLWIEIYRSTGVLITPPNGFGQSKKGLYRMVVSYFDKEGSEIIMSRIHNFISEKRNNL